jgi:hypothetical protein
MRDVRVAGFRCWFGPTREDAEANAEHKHPVTQADSFQVLFMRTARKKASFFRLTY